MEKTNRIQYLVDQLNAASNAYYGGFDEIMSNYEWDTMFDELQNLESQTGYVLPNSPTHHVSQSNIDDNRNKEMHEFPALSLAKTKSIADLQEWASDYDVWVSWKLDGLTLVLTYDKGELTKILTRGDGRIGTNITFMKHALRGVPSSIHYKGHLVVRGEAIISYSDFEYVNNTLNGNEDKYANPRNLAAGTLGLDISKLSVVKERRVSFIAFSLVAIEESIISWGDRMRFLDDLGFRTVNREKTTSSNLPEIVKSWTNKVESKKIDLPVDGLVLCYDDTEYAATGSITEHHATRAGLAFKWQDVVAITTLNYIEWSCATSCITPIAVFDPVQLEGTTVSRASLCNISEMERLGIGENHNTVLKIIKANKIIPKCIGVVRSEGSFSIPTTCPVCGMDTVIKVNSHSTTKTLHCINSNCPAKHLRRFVRFVSKKGASIDGLSIQTLIVFINRGIIKNYQDIFNLYKYKDQIINLDGFGEKSCDKLLSAIERSRSINPINFIYALNIPFIGIDAAKRIINEIGFSGFMNRLNSHLGFEDIEGIGPEKSSSLLSWIDIPENRNTLMELLSEVLIINNELGQNKSGLCSGLVFVITGNLFEYKNRKELSDYIEEQGGRVTNSISTKTSYLINNDYNSTSSKNEKAKLLGISVISEKEFISLFCRKHPN